MDFYTCREAQWLVGWPGTTFGRTLAALQIYDHETTGGWYQVCPAGGATAKEAGPTIKRIHTYNEHQACMATSETLVGQRAAMALKASGKSANAAGRRLDLLARSRIQDIALVQPPFGTVGKTPP